VADVVPAVTARLDGEKRRSYAASVFQSFMSLHDVKAAEVRSTAAPDIIILYLLIFI
jgi:hypothetical protein